MGSFKIQSTPSVQQQAGPVILNREQKTGQDFGGGAFTALSRVSDSIAKQQQLAEDRADNAIINEAVNSLNTWSNESRYGDNGLYSKKGKNSIDASEALMSEYDMKVMEISTNLNSQRQKDVFSIRAQSMRNSLQAEAMKYENVEFENFEKQQHQDFLTSQQVEAQNHYSDLPLVNVSYSNQVAEIRKNGVLNGLPEETIKLQELDAANKTFGGVMEQYVNNRQFDSARAFIKSKESELSPDFYDKAINFIGTKQNEFLAAQKQANNELRERTFVQLSLSEMDGTLREKEVDDAYNNKLLTANQYLSFKESLKKNSNAYDFVQTSIDLGIPLDPGDTSKGGDVEKVDMYYKSESKGWDKEDRVANTLGLIKDTNIVPKTVISRTRAGIRSGDVTQSYAAADFINKVLVTTPKAIADFDSADLSFSKQVVEMVAAGVPQEEAVKTATRNVFQTTQAEKTAYQNLFNENKDDSQSWLDSVIDEELDDFWFKSVPSSDPVMLAEFDTLTRNYIATTGGDIEAARDLAWRDLRRVWGGSELGFSDGDNESKVMMKYSPEVIYGNGYGKSDWIIKQFETETEGLNKPFIAYDSRTARERFPSYPVMYLDKKGRVSPYLVDGIPQRWKPDFKATPEYIEAQKEKEKAIERAKQERADILSGAAFDRELEEAISRRFP